MWFKLAGATFTNNLGTMDSISKSYMMDYSGLTGLQASPGSVSYATDSTPDATITFTVKSGYVFKTGATVTASGGASKTYTASADLEAGSTFTMALTGITGKVTFTGAAELVSIVNPEPETPSGSIGDITALTLVDGNPWGSAAQQTAKNRVHSSTALYCPAGTTISCKDTTTYKWALRKVTSDTNLTATETSYKPDSVWTTKTSYTTTDDGYWCFILVKASDADFDWSTESNKVSDYFTVS